MMDQQHVLHLLNRIGFGYHPKLVQLLSKQSRNETVQQLFLEFNKSIPLQVIDDQLSKADFKSTTPEDRKEKKEQIKELTHTLNAAWFAQICDFQNVVRNRMVYFWFNHFVCKSSNIVFAQRYHNILMEHAFDNLASLTIAVSQSAAMLSYLNNRQNRKEAPNENFARELLELYLLGHGNYSELDVKEAARAFTGWRFIGNGVFQFRSTDHDHGIKTFLGQTGNFNGYDIISICLQQQACAHHIAKSIYLHFVNDEVNDDEVNQVAQKLLKSNYNIYETMKFLFNSDWFYREEHIQQKLKTPIQLLATVANTFNAVPTSNDKLWKLQNLLDEVIMYPPNVGGFPKGMAWIDSASLIQRLRLPSMLLNGGILNMDMEQDAAAEDPYMMQHKFQYQKNVSRFEWQMDWKKFEANFVEGNKLEKLSFILFNNALSTKALSSLFTIHENSAKVIALKLISLPEFQMC